MNPALFFSQTEKQAIRRAVRGAEMKTSGEIRVHLERKAREPFLENAEEVFEKTGMTRTAERNGVLIFIGLASRRYAILGDKGIHEKVPEGFWDKIAQQMGEEFRQDRFADGVVAAVEQIGERLQEYFPYQRDDVNELPDEISYSL
ncbi:MAG: TPM domain-containing protein [Candidatus Omnitrophica bacterium]|nr:TPM domain-containing protein [Candidatus Omnitrophota bacterium]